MSMKAADNSLRLALVALMVTALTGCGQPTVVRHYTTQLFTRTPEASIPVDKTATAPEPVTVHDAPVAAVPDGKSDPIPRYSHAWSRMRDNFQLPTARDPRLDRQIVWYQRNANSLRNSLDRADPFIGWILDQLEEQNLPAELALLPVIESSYQPLARSPGGASGLWQFISGTGNRFGLKESRWYDGRRDVIASTQAAMEYFAFLRDEFSGDWLLALAAYNCGEGTVARAIQRNRSRGLPEDFWHLDLPSHTLEYVPKLLALRDIVATHGHYGIKLPNLDAETQIALVDTPKQIDLGKAANLAGISMDDMRRLNPGLKRHATAPNGQLVIPVDVADKFAAQLANLDYDNRTSLATPSEPKVSSPAIAANATSTAAVPPKNRQTLHYTVRRGDSLLQISRRYRVTVSSLRAWNDLKSDQYLQPGQKLTLYLDTRMRADGSDGSDG